jgi:hypothetical protein
MYIITKKAPDGEKYIVEMKDFEDMMLHLRNSHDKTPKHKLISVVHEEGEDGR